MSSTVRAQNAVNELAITTAELQALTNLSDLRSAEKNSASKIATRELLKRVIESSPALEEARYGIRAAKNQVDASRGYKQPQITVTGQSRYLDGDIPSTSRITGKPSYNLSAVLPIFDGGRIDARLRGSEGSLSVNNTNLELQALRVLQEATLTCLEINRQRALLAANNVYLANVKKLTESLSVVAKADSGRAGELVQARSRQMQAESSNTGVASSIIEAQMRLERLLGKKDDWACNNIGPHFQQLTEINQLLGKISQHPQLRQLDYEYQIQLTEVEQISAQRKPLVQLGASYAAISPGYTDQYATSIGITISAPIYDGNILKSSELAAINRGTSIIERREQISRTLVSESKERHVRASTNLRRVEEYIELLKINDRVRKDFFMQWSEMGRRSLYELLAIEAEQFSLQSGYITSLYTALSDSVVLYANAGDLTSEFIDSLGLATVNQAVPVGN